MNIKKVVLLNKVGDIIDGIEKPVDSYNSGNIYPLVIENYVWNKEMQRNSAEIYKDKIKRVYDIDNIPGETKKMVEDDICRIDLIKTFDYGPKVLEVGCSDGTVSIKLAELPTTELILGIDIRQSAIDDGHNLIDKLVKEKKLTNEAAKKVRLEEFRIEDLPVNYGKYDSVCAYEIFEHMAPQDLLPAFQHLYKFIKKDGNFYISVPNRFPADKYEKEKRARWKWDDHRNFFSKISLEIFLSNFFEAVDAYPLDKNEAVEDSIYLIYKCIGKKYD